MNSSTEYTPNYMMYGREFCIPDVVLPSDEPAKDARLMKRRWII
jgi:hypothetical protein